MKKGEHYKYPEQFEALILLEILIFLEKKQKIINWKKKYIYIYIKQFATINNMEKTIINILWYRNQKTKISPT